MTDRRKQYFAIQNVMTKVEKDLVSYYELQWFMGQNIPTIEEVATHLKITQVALNYHLQRKPVIKALEIRGIPFKQHTQSELTATQVATAITMANFADSRTNDQKLDQLGINAAQYYAWQNDPQFQNLVSSLADQNLNNIKPTAINELTKKINAGDWNAIKYYLDVTGDVNKDAAPQSETLMRMIIEVLQDEIKDPEVIMRIAQRLKAATTNRTIEVVEVPAITSYVVEEDLELAAAKKKLGVM
jgi:glutathione peroxidase-family protein